MKGTAQSAMAANRYTAGSSHTRNRKTNKRATDVQECDTQPTSEQAATAVHKSTSQRNIDQISEETRQNDPKEGDEGSCCIGAGSQNSSGSSQSSNGPPQLPLDVVQEYCPLSSQENYSVEGGQLLNLSQDCINLQDPDVLTILRSPKRQDSNRGTSPTSPILSTSATKISRFSAAVDTDTAWTVTHPLTKVSKEGTSFDSRLVAGRTQTSTVVSQTLPLFVTEMSQSPLVSPNLSSTSVSSSSQELTLSQSECAVRTQYDQVDDGAPNPKSRRATKRKKKESKEKTTKKRRTEPPVQETSASKRGKDDIKSGATPMETTSSQRMEDKLDDKKERRRDQNRRAAQRSRQKKRETSQHLLKDYQRLQCTNTNLRYQINQLRRERDELAAVVREHMKTCTVAMVSPGTTTGQSTVSTLLSTPSICLASNVVGSVLYRQSRARLSSTVSTTSLTSVGTIGNAAGLATPEEDDDNPCQSAQKPSTTQTGGRASRASSRAVKRIREAPSSISSSTSVNPGNIPMTTNPSISAGTSNKPTEFQNFQPSGTSGTGILQPVGQDNRSSNLQSAAISSSLFDASAAIHSDTTQTIHTIGPVAARPSRATQSLPAVTDTSRPHRPTIPQVLRPHSSGTSTLPSDWGRTHRLRLSTRTRKSSTSRARVMESNDPKDSDESHK